MRNVCRLLWVLALLLAGAMPLHAHSMYQSAVLLDFHAGSVGVRLELPPSRLRMALQKDLGAGFGGAVDAGNVAALAPVLEPYLLQRLNATTDGKPWTIHMAGPPRFEVADGNPYVVADLVLTPPAGATVRQFVLRDDVITDALSNHVVLVSVRSDWNSSTFASEPELLGVLNGEQRTIEIDRSQGSWTRGFGSVFRLGTRHIAEGTDHLLFLLALLLPAPLLVCATTSRHGRRWCGAAPVRHGFQQILKVVTAFTAGHSITLALAASGSVHVPAAPIEVLIAVSILVSAVHALRPLFPGREPLIAGSFGMIHGLAFASTLAELGLYRWERVLGLLAFNLGIEAMQLLVVLCVMPSLLLLSRTAVYPAFRTVGASLAAVAAAGWILERTTHCDLHVDSAVNLLAQHAVACAVTLFVGSTLLYVHARTMFGRSRG